MKPADFLKKVPLFQSLRAEDLEHLAASIRVQSLRKGEVLFRKGSEGTALFIIKKGNIKISLPSSIGEEVILAIFSNGDFLGEMAILDGMPRSTDAVAIEPSELFVLSRSDFLSFLKNDEDTIKSILSVLSMRLRKTDDFLVDTCFRNISARLAKTLVELGKKYGHQKGNSTEIYLRLTQKDLASMVGSTRESVNKELRILREKGLISISGKTIRISNLERLKRRFR